MKASRRLIAVCLVLGWGVATAQDVDISESGLGKQQLFFQSSSAAPIFITYSFTAFVNRQNGGTINSVTANGPGPGSPYTLNDNGGGFSYDSYEDFEQTFTTGTAFAASYPNGGYAFTVNTPTHVNTAVNFTLSPDAYPVDVPTITGGTWSGGLLILDTTVATSVTFNSFSTMINNVDMIEMTFEGESIGVGITTRNPTGAFSLPANLLNSNETFAASLTFYKVVSGYADGDPGNPIPGAEALGFYAFKTYFAVQTIPEPSTYALFAAGLGAMGLVAWRRHVRRV